MLRGSPVPFVFVAAVVLGPFSNPSQVAAQLQVSATADGAEPLHGPDSTAYARYRNGSMMFKGSIMVLLGTDWVYPMAIPPGKTAFVNFGFYSAWENGVDLYSVREKKIVYANSRGYNPVGLRAVGDYRNRIAIHNNSNEPQVLYVISWHKPPGNYSDQDWVQNRAQVVSNRDGSVDYKFEDGHGHLSFDAANLHVMIR